MMTLITRLFNVNYAKILAYNAILKFPDNGPIMLRNAPIMLKVAPIMLKVLALFLSNLVHACKLISMMSFTQGQRLS